ncbi:hypothetical protein EKO04_010120 [Ascochyta lentis]|uniref:Uncharacterized protein n=1 Tax=Ascochyta lentis TaxID=205686 RepID=A0A8H7IUT5_9PLEO|nr:hypothetical protein EKO04_010120 [Ascochyta lentis]
MGVGTALEVEVDVEVGVEDDTSNEDEVVVTEVALEFELKVSEDVLEIMLEVLDGITADELEKAKNAISLDKEGLVNVTDEIEIALSVADEKESMKWLSQLRH